MGVQLGRHVAAFSRAPVADGDGRVSLAKQRAQLLGRPDVVRALASFGVARAVRRIGVFGREKGALRREYRCRGEVGRQVERCGKEQRISGDEVRSGVSVQELSIVVEPEHVSVCVNGAY